MPQAGISTHEDAMPIELGHLLIDKCNFWQILKSTKFLEAPESTKIWTSKSSNRPSTTAGLRLEGALARYRFLIDETETTAWEGADLDSIFVFDWHTRVKCLVCCNWSRLHLGQDKCTAHETVVRFTYECCSRNYASPWSNPRENRMDDPRLNNIRDAHSRRFTLS